MSPCLKESIAITTALCALFLCWLGAAYHLNFKQEVDRQTLTVFPADKLNNIVRTICRCFIYCPTWHKKWSPINFCYWDELFLLSRCFQCWLKCRFWWYNTRLTSNGLKSKTWWPESAFSQNCCSLIANEFSVIWGLWLWASQVDVYSSVTQWCVTLMEVEPQSKCTPCMYYNNRASSWYCGLCRSPHFGTQAQARWH